MKKITFTAFLLLSAVMNAQTFAIYTEDPTIGAGVNSLRFSNGQGFTLTEPTAAPFEGTKNYLFAFNGTSSYYHAIMFPRNAANTADASVSLADYSYYNVSIKTVSSTPFYLRIRGNGVTAKVLIDPAASSYGFTNDNQWHLLSIPLADFIPESAAFNIANISEIFVLRSNISGSTAGTPNDYHIDNIYASVNQVLNVKDQKTTTFSMFPNPAENALTFSASENITTISIYSILGQKITELKPQSNTFTTDISNLQSGVYVVNVESNGKTSTSKFVKK